MSLSRMEFQGLYATYGPAVRAPSGAAREKTPRGPFRTALRERDLKRRAKGSASATSPGRKRRAQRHVHRADAAGRARAPTRAPG